MRGPVDSRGEVDPLAGHEVPFRLGREVPLDARHHVVVVVRVVVK